MVMGLTLDLRTLREFKICLFLNAQNITLDPKVIVVFGRMLENPQKIAKLKKYVVYITALCKLNPKQKYIIQVLFQSVSVQACKTPKTLK